MITRQARYLMPKKQKRVNREAMQWNTTRVVKVLRKLIFKNYDFLGVTERMEESLAVMVLLWDLEPRDVVVLNSKSAGGYDDGGHNKTCKIISKAPNKKNMTRYIKDYLEHRHSLWNTDTLLYHAVNTSLDMTIDELGRERVNQMVETIRELQQVAHDQCLKEAEFPCNQFGVFQPDRAEESCYIQDAGCGYKCVDRVLQNFLSYKSK
jgi:hypothetical protein